MGKLTAEMKAKLAAAKSEAEVNARIRAGAIAPKIILKAPSTKQPKIIPEREVNFYRDGVNPVSASYEYYEYES